MRGGEPDWRPTIRVSEDPSLRSLLTGRLAPASDPPPTRVTDLVDLRRAYWRAIAPVRLAPERLERMELGRAQHRRFERALAAEGAAEVRVRRDGFVGRIDLLSDIPIEVKSAASIVPASELLEARADQLEQLAMYVALTDRPSGRLVTIGPDGPGGPAVQAIDIGVGSADAVRTAMRARAGALVRAWQEHRAETLPKCSWRHRGCEFEAAGVCDCSDGDPAADEGVLSQIGGLTERTDVEERLTDRLRVLPAPEEEPLLDRFRELLYPRRSYFERTRPAPGGERPRRDPLEPPELFARLLAALEGGPVGDVARLIPRTGEPLEEIPGYRGVPFLVRTTRARRLPTAASLVEEAPQYALELALRCVAIGGSEGLLVLGSERASRDEERLWAFRYHLTDPSVISRWWRERRRGLVDAIALGEPRAAAACPSWMYADCPYRVDCACGAVEARSQR